MTKDRRESDEELQAIMDGLAESVAEASDAEILEEAADAGEDIEGTAQNLRTRLLATVRGYRQRYLEAARKNYEMAIGSIKRSAFNLPKDRTEQRIMFTALLARRPDFSNLLTAQHRDLNKLSDADLEGCLRHLAALGVLDDVSGNSDQDK